MFRYYVSLRNECTDWEDTDIQSNNLRKMTAEARDLQRILSPEKKDAGMYYAVFERLGGDLDDFQVYSANGY